MPRQSEDLLKKQVSVWRMTQKAQIKRVLYFLFAIIIMASQSGYAQDDFSFQTTSLTPYSEYNTKPRISKFSSLPVPRYASLKYDEVNGRAGPSLKYPIRWQYRKSGLPVLVVRESEHWRKIQDPHGDEVWVHKRMLGPKRTGITSEQIYLFAKPDMEAKRLAEISSGVVSDIKECEGDWCSVEVAGYTGWVNANAIWGVDDLR